MPDKKPIETFNIIPPPDEMAEKDEVLSKAYNDLLFFGRAFLPNEFAQFRVSLDESRARFDEGIEQVRRLLEEEDVTAVGKFHSFEAVTSLPRPTQSPRPPFWVAAVGTPDSFTRAGRSGYGIMAIPLTGGQMADLIGRYREAWQSARHPGRGQVMLAFHMFCHEDSSEAMEVAREPLNRYLRTLTSAASGWAAGASSPDYPGYDKMVAALAEETFETQVAKGAAWIGDPKEVRDQVQEYYTKVGGFEIASMQVNFNTIEVGDAEASMRLFSAEVMPHFK